MLSLERNPETRLDPGQESRGADRRAHRGQRQGAESRRDANLPPQAHVSAGQRVNTPLPRPSPPRRVTPEQMTSPPLLVTRPALRQPPLSEQDIIAMAMKATLTAQAGVKLPGTRASFVDLVTEVLIARLAQGHASTSSRWPDREKTPNPSAERRSAGACVSRFFVIRAAIALA
ncbi:hypothetical protein AAFF_G00222830 [Aldrovandia affinis]|uniref:Uncharacterized protein n=1 Tax=Aldrovandia affinis TaxID=143900 RepID=A0AAD7RFM0_9TELE|nr:hypothetical protein AAFF_G00222830 [Aldrovandia affinis]